jgi:hypothetical protein
MRLSTLGPHEPFACVSETSSVSCAPHTEALHASLCSPYYEQLSGKGVATTEGVAHPSKRELHPQFRIYKGVNCFRACLRPDQPHPYLLLSVSRLRRFGYSTLGLPVCQTFHTFTNTKPFLFRVGVVNFRRDAPLNATRKARHETVPFGQPQPWQLLGSRETSAT